MNASRREGTTVNCKHDLYKDVGHPEEGVEGVPRHHAHFLDDGDPLSLSVKIRYQTHSLRDFRIRATRNEHGYKNDNVLDHYCYNLLQVVYSLREGVVQTVYNVR